MVGCRRNWWRLSLVDGHQIVMGWGREEEGREDGGRWIAGEKNEE